MPDINTLLPYIYATTGLIIIILIWIAYQSWKLKRIILKEINQPNISNGNFQYQNNPY